MPSIPVNLSNGSYEVRVGVGLLNDLPNQLAAQGLGEPYLVVSQTRVLKSVGKRFSRKSIVVTIPDGERAKTLTTVDRLIDTMVKNKLTRQSTVIALGGGVVGDVAGFAASIYMRGIALVQVPTTLLAQVDSSIGGKNGVNHRFAKNMIGTFYQPRLVISDPSVLRSLPEREYVNGLFEAVEYGLIQSPGLFNQFETGIGSFLSRDLEAVERLVSACAAIKAAVVAADEREGDLRRILNFGHTVGHAIEVAGNYRSAKHGEAVGYGMIAATRIATTLGQLPDSDRIRIENVVRSVGKLPNLRDVKVRSVLNALPLDKKVRDGRIHFILPRAIGRVEITSDVPFAVVSDVVRQLLNESRKGR